MKQTKYVGAVILATIMLVPAFTGVGAVIGVRGDYSFENEADTTGASGAAMSMSIKLTPEEIWTSEEHELMAQKRRIVEESLISMGLENDSRITPDLMRELAGLATSDELDTRLDALIEEDQVESSLTVISPTDQSTSQATGEEQDEEVLAVYMWRARFTYYSFRNETDWNPVRGANVQVKDQWGGTVAEGHTDEDGWVTFYLNQGSYVMIVYADGATNKVANTNLYPAGSAWSVSTGYVSLTQDRIDPYHRIRSTLPDHCRVFECYNTIRMAWRWLKSHTPSPGWSCPHVTTFYPHWDESHGMYTAFYPFGMGCEIFVPASWANALYSAISPIHEWGHVVHYWVRGGIPSGGTLMDHDVWMEAVAGSGTNWGFALMEGWAEFFPCAVWNTTVSMSPGDIEYGGGYIRH